MDFVLIGIGIVMLLITYWDCQQNETDTMCFCFFIDWWVNIDISRRSSPRIFGLVIIIQTLIGFGCIAKGVINIS